MYLKYLEQTNALHVFVVVVVYALLGVFVVVCFAWCVVYALLGVFVVVYALLFVLCMLCLVCLLLCVLCLVCCVCFSWCVCCCVCFAWCVVYAGQGEEQSLSSRVEPQSLTAPRVDLQNTPQRLYPYRPS